MPTYDEEAKFNPSYWEPIYAIAEGTPFPPRSSRGLCAGSGRTRRSNDRFANGSHELHEFRFVQTAVGAESTADIDTERGDLSDSSAYVVGIQSTGEKYRHIDGVAYSSAHRPVVRSTGAPELFDRQSRLS